MFSYGGDFKISWTFLVIKYIFEANSCLKLPLVVVILNSKAVLVIAASLAPFFGGLLAWNTWGFKRGKIYLDLNTLLVR